MSHRPNFRRWCVALLVALGLAGNVVSRAADDADATPHNCQVRIEIRGKLPFDRIPVVKHMIAAITESVDQPTVDGERQIQFDVDLLPQHILAPFPAFAACPSGIGCPFAHGLSATTGIATVDFEKSECTAGRECVAQTAATCPASTCVAKSCAGSTCPASVGLAACQASDCKTATCETAACKTSNCTVAANAAAACGKVCGPCGKTSEAEVVQLDYFVKQLCPASQQCCTELQATACCEERCHEHGRSAEVAELHAAIQRLETELDARKAITEAREQLFDRIFELTRENAHLHAELQTQSRLQEMKEVLLAAQSENVKLKAGLEIEAEKLAVAKGSMENALEKERLKIRMAELEVRAQQAETLRTATQAPAGSPFDRN